MPKVLNFQAIIERDEDGYYVARVPTVPGCYTQGKSYEEALEKIKEVLEICLEDAASDPNYKKQIIFPEQADKQKYIGLETVQVNAAF